MGVALELERQSTYELSTDVRVWEGKNPPKQGSMEWMQVVYPLESVSESIDRVSAKLAGEHREDELLEIVGRFETMQLFFYLTEYGAGKKLPIQPSYWGELHPSDDGLRVFTPNLHDYGDQKESYVSFDGIDEVVRKGLDAIYENLNGMDVGEGMFRVSPSEFYKQFGSKNDVVEFYRISKIYEDGRREFEARYLVLDRVLSREERLFLANNCYGSFENIPQTTGNERVSYSIDNLALNPQKIRLEDVDDSILLMMWEMVNRFEAKFQTSLVKDTDFVMYEKIMKRVSENLPSYLDLLMAKEIYATWYLLKSMMFGSQRDWAMLRGIDPARHIHDIEDGQFVIGFEVGFDGIDPVFDSVFNNRFSNWLEHTILGNCYCHIHRNRYVGNCLDCNLL